MRTSFRALQVLRNFILLVAGVTVLLVALSYEHWGTAPILGVVGIAHVLLAAVLALKQERESTVQWLALAMVLLGARFAGTIMSPSWMSLGTGMFFLPGALSPIAASALLMFAQRFGSDDSVRPPRPRSVRHVDRLCMPIGMGIAIVFLWRPGSLDPELFHTPWHLFAVARSYQYVSANFQVATTHERLRLKWLLFASLFWVLAPVVLVFQVFGIPGRLALTVAAGLVFVGSAVLVFGMVGHGTLDPTLIMERTALVAALVTMLAFLFGVVEAALSDLVLNRSGLPSGTGLWVAAGLIAVLIRPLERFLAPRINHWLEKWDIGVETYTATGGL